MQKSLKIILITTILVSSLSILPAAFGWEQGTTETVLVSEEGVEVNYGAIDFDGFGFPQPLDGAWGTAVSAWRHPSFNDVTNIQSELYDPEADWIWRIYKATEDEAKTGSVVFFKEEIYIEGEIDAATLSITADNAFYVFVSSEADHETGGPFEGTAYTDVWSGEPLYVNGFVDDDIGNAFEQKTENDIILPKKGRILTDSRVVNSIEHVNLLPLYDVAAAEDLPYYPGLKPGRNLLCIVAVNAQPQPKDKWTSQNTAGLIYKLDITTGGLPLEYPDGVGFTVQVGGTTPIPDVIMTDFINTLPLNVPVPIQAALMPDYDDDGDIDLILGKEATIIVRTLPGVADVKVDFPGYSEYSNAKDPVEDLFYFPNFIPSGLGGQITATRYDSIDVIIGSATIDFEVIDTLPLQISYYGLDGSELRKGYGNSIYSDFVPETTEFLSAVFPVEEVIIDGITEKPLAGASAGSRKDPFKGMITDAINAAQDAQLRLGGAGIGVAIGPIQGSKDYFDYQGFPGAAGVSFGPSVKGVIVLDGYWTSVAHEIAHIYGLYWGEPEQYQVDQLYGSTASGMWVGREPDTNYWSSGLDIMGVGPEQTLEDTWMLAETYEKLTEQLKENPADPTILLASGVIYAPSDSNPEKSVELVVDWKWIDEGFPNVFEPSGDYSLSYSETETGAPLPNTEETPWVYFDAPFSVNIFPEIGTPLTGAQFSEEPNNFGAFAFATVYPEQDNINWIQLWDHTGKKPVLLHSLAVEQVEHTFVEANFNVDGELWEGGTVDFDASTSISGPGDIVDWSWDFGDGNIGSGLKPFNIYLDDGTYTVTLTVTADSGLVDIVTQDIDIVNRAPVVELGGPASGVEGSPISFSGSFTDPGSLDTHTIEWSFGDGGTDAGTLTPTHTYADNGPYTVTLTVTDNDGGEGTDTIVVNVENVAPVVDAGADETASEGSPISFSGSFTDSGSLDTHTIDWSFGDGGTDAGTLTPTHTYADDGSYTVTLTVTDGEGGEGTDTMIVNVENVAPTATLGNSGPVDEGSPVTVLFTNMNDPGDDTYLYSFDWDNDGTYEIIGQSPESATHTWNDNGEYTVGASIQDEDGGSTEYTTTVIVDNVAPVVNAGPDQMVIWGQSTSIPVSISDPGADTWTISVDYDEGDGLQLLGPRPSSFSLSHTYSEVGYYTITVEVDDGDAIGSDQLTVFVVKTWFTDTSYKELTHMEPIFTVKQNEPYNYFHNTKPGEVMINLQFVEEDAFTVRLDLPYVDEVPEYGDLSQEGDVAAFDYHQGNPIHVTTGSNGENEITKKNWIDYKYDENAVEISIPSSAYRKTSLVYITVHFEYALIGTSGWTDGQVDGYREDLTFQISYIKEGVTHYSYSTDFLVAGNYP